MPILDRLTDAQHAELVQFITDAVTTFESLAKYVGKTGRDHPTSAADARYCEMQAARGRELLERI